MWTLGVVDQVEGVDLMLELVERLGQRLFVEVPEQRLVEAFIFPLSGRFVRLACDGFHTKSGHMRNELAGQPTSRCVECSAVVCEESLGHSVRGDRLVEDDDRSVRGFAVSDMGGYCVSRMVVDQLEDGAAPTTGEDVFGGV